MTWRQRRPPRPGRKHWRGIAGIALILATAISGGDVSTAGAAEDEIKAYNTGIDQRKTEIEKIKRRIEAYEKQINETRKEAANLRNQISLVENEIAKTELDIELTTKQIAATNLEIQRTQREILTHNNRIIAQQRRIAQLLQLIYRNDQVSYLEIMVTRPRLSDFFDSYQRLQDVQERLQQALTELKVFKRELELQQATLTKKKAEEEELKATLTQQRQNLTEKARYHATLLEETERSEQKFSRYVQELKAEQRQNNAEIVDLERKIRQELERRQEAERLASFGEPRLRWPTDGRYITTKFHDNEYPFRYVYEHPGLDIRTPQGSPVYAAEGGYVAKIKDGGAKGYSYVMLIHNTGLASVYGHVSGFEVRAEEFVARGQLIARSGGTPGTRGAGKLTTGPHLHFEVRRNGIPVDPIGYLP